MSQPRIEMNATILPNGKVLADGRIDERRGCRDRKPERRPLRSGYEHVHVRRRERYPRLYHSGSLLLPDATVLLVGGNPTRGTYEAHMEIYSPAYLFNADGTAALRPTITGVTPGAFALRRNVSGADTGRRRHRVGRAGAAGRADARVRHGSAAGGAVLHGWQRAC